MHLLCNDCAADMKIRSNRGEHVGAGALQSTLQHTVGDGTIATPCNSLQLTATRCNTLQLTATHQLRGTSRTWRWNSLQLTATRCNTLQLTTTYQLRGTSRSWRWNSITAASPTANTNLKWYVVECCSALQCAAVRCSVLQCVAVCCSVQI